MANSLKKLNIDVDLLDNIIKYAPDWIYWKDENSIHLGCNDQFARAAGFSSHKEMIGKSDHDFPWKDRADKYILDDKAVINSGMPKLNIEDTVVVHDGSEVIVISNKVPLRNAQGHVIGVLGIATDVTHLKMIEEKLSIAKEAAEAASRAKSVFIANISHDTRTPLTGVIGLSQALEVEHISDKERIEYAKLIHDSGDSLLEFSERVLDDVTADALTEDKLAQESFDIRKIINDVIRLEHPTTEVNHLDIKTEIDSDIPAYSIGDRLKLHRILLNLTGNAIKFTQAGSVELSARLLSKTDTRAQIEFAVKDTGIGIAPEHQSKIFDQFFKVTPSYKGLYTGYGLGLHIVQKFVNLMGGNIKLESTLNEGTKISFILDMAIGDVPKNVEEEISSQYSRSTSFSLTNHTDGEQVCNNAENPALCEGRGSSAQSINKIQILLVEDNITALQALSAMMRGFKATIYTANDAETAYELVQKEYFEMIITDIGLPGKQGDELTAMIRDLEAKEHRLPAAIVGCTGHTALTEHERCLKLGMNEVFTKPMTPDKLKNLMEKYGNIRKAVTANVIQQTSTKKGLGLDLPDTEAELFEISKHPLLDLQIGISLFQDERVARQILAGVGKDGVLPELPLIEKAYAEGNWSEVERLAHKMKGGACYGTVRLYYALLYMERYKKAGHTRCLEQLYEQMMNTIEETLEHLENMY